MSQTRTTLWAVADLHAAVKANAEHIDSIRPTDPSDWLIVAGDVAERTETILFHLAELRRRFRRVIWVPGNHELFSRATDRYKGREKYQQLVEGCRDIGVLTPEDPYPVFGGVTICPLFTLYDYSFRPAGTSVEEALAAAQDNGVVLSDEYAIAPYVDIRGWCWERLAYSVKRLARITGPTILINHWPLVQEPTAQLRHQEIALWCGSRHTRSWPTRYQAQKVIYGHLHIPSTIEVDGVPHVEVSLGYPREWRRWEKMSNPPQWPYKVMSIDNVGRADDSGRDFHA